MVVEIALAPLLYLLHCPVVYDYLNVKFEIPVAALEASKNSHVCLVAAARGASGALLNYNHALNFCSSPPTARVSRQLTSYQVAFFQDLSRYPRHQRPIDDNVFSLRLHDASVIAKQAYKRAQPDAETRESIVSDIDRAVRALVFRDRVTEALVRGGETEA